MGSIMNSVAKGVTLNEGAGGMHYVKLPMVIKVEQVPENSCFLNQHLDQPH